jgi:drug/metabolite transporter (DMT)-like permease
VPDRLSIKCGAAVVSNTIAYSYAIYFTNFPIVMMVRSCNLLSVALVAVLFTGVKDTKLKLGTRKIVVALIVTIGIIIFKVFDPNQHGEENKTQLFGIALIVISIVAEGFLPDFQAVIK